MKALIKVIQMLYRSSELRTKLVLRIATAKKTMLEHNYDLRRGKKVKKEKLRINMKELMQIL